MTSERIENHLMRLQEARDHLNAALDRVPDDLWEQQIYSDGAQWTLRQLLIHLMLADHGQTNVLMGIAEGKNLIPDDYDLNRYNSRSVSKSQDVTVAEARANFAASRERLIEWLTQLDDSLLDKEGRHVTLQFLSIGQILNVMTGHEKSHTADIEAMIAQNV